MACAVHGGQRVWSGGIDEEGFRTYKVSFIVKGTAGTDGPAQALQATGLPAIGDTYAITGSEVDIWAWRRPETEVRPHGQEGGERHEYQEVICTYSTRKPQRGREMDPASLPDDPLAQPPRISGRFVKKTVEATDDKYGRPINTSSHEQIRGAQNEWDDHTQAVTIEQNVATLDTVTIGLFMNHLNSETLWGNPPRTIKLSDCSWNKQWVGTVSYYYVRTLEFDINPKGFDRNLLDEGTKVLNGRWGVEGEQDSWIVEDLPDGTTPNPDNPSHFIRAIDRQGNPTKVILDGAGKPWDPDYATTLEFVDRGQWVPPETGLPTSSGATVTGFTGTLQAGGALVPGYQYQYAITAVVAGVESVYSATGAITATMATRTVKLVWNKVTNATEYRIYRTRYNIGAIPAQDWGLITALKAGNPGYRWTEKYYDADLALLDLPSTL